MPYGRWVIDQSNTRVQAAQSVLAAEQATVLARDAHGRDQPRHGRSVSGSAVPIAGKTGTAELIDGPSHAWFIGYAPSRQ